MDVSCYYSSLIILLLYILSEKLRGKGYGGDQQIRRVGQNIWNWDHINVSVCINIFLTPNVWGKVSMYLGWEFRTLEARRPAERGLKKKAGNKRKRAWMEPVVREMAKLGQIQGWGLWKVLVTRHFPLVSFSIAWGSTSLFSFPELLQSYCHPFYSCPSLLCSLSFFLLLSNPSKFSSIPTSSRTLLGGFIPLLPPPCP